MDDSRLPGVVFFPKVLRASSCAAIGNVPPASTDAFLPGNGPEEAEKTWITSREKTTFRISTICSTWFGKSGAPSWLRSADEEASGRRVSFCGRPRRIPIFPSSISMPFARASGISPVAGARRRCGSSGTGTRPPSKSRSTSFAFSSRNRKRGPSRFWRLERHRDAQNFLGL